MCMMDKWLAMNLVSRSYTYTVNTSGEVAVPRNSGRTALKITKAIPESLQVVAKASGGDVNLVNFYVDGTAPTTTQITPLEWYLSREMYGDALAAEMTISGPFLTQFRVTEWFYPPDVEEAIRRYTPNG